MISFDIRLEREAQAFRFTATLGSGITAVIGRSGAGKTTLARLLAGLLRPTAGRITFNDRCIYDSERGLELPPEARGIGFVFQTHRVFPHLSVRRNLAFAPAFCGRRSPVTLDAVAEHLHLTPLLDRPAATLSGGEAQRCALGRAILAAQELLILDEPLANLDPALKEEMLDCLESLPAILHVPMLCITHSPTEARRLAPTTLLVHEGTIAFSGPTDKALSQPQYFGDGA